MIRTRMRIGMRTRINTKIRLTKDKDKHDEDKGT